VSVTSAEIIVPLAGVTGFGVAVRVWMIGPPVLLAELALAPPPVEELAPPLLELPLPNAPPVPVVALLAWQNPSDFNAESVPAQDVSSLAFTAAAQVGPSEAGKPGAAQQTESAVQLGVEELVELALLPHATASVTRTSAARALRLGRTAFSRIVTTLRCVGS
jgi:hypothetical protein